MSTSSSSPRPIKARTRTRGAHKAPEPAQPEPARPDPNPPDLNRLFGLDKLDEIEVAPEDHLSDPPPEDDLPAREPTPKEALRSGYDALGAWLEGWRTSAKGWPYTNRDGFNVVVYRHGEGWAFRIVAMATPEAGAAPAKSSPVLLWDSGYANETAAKLASFRAWRHLRSQGERP